MSAPRLRQVTLKGQSFAVHEWGPETGSETGPDSAPDSGPDSVPDSGPYLLCLHGFPEYGGAWTDLAAALIALRPDLRIIAPDQRGFGQSWAPQEVADYATGKLVGDMVALIDALGARPAAVIGHDWGAAVAYGLAISRPDLVARLIILNGVHPVPFQRALAAGGAQTETSQYITWLRRDGSESALAADGFARLRAMFAAHMDMGWLSGDRLDAYLAQWARPGRLRAMVNWYRASPLVVPAPGEAATDLPDWPLERLRVHMPHLLIWGARDTALLPEATEGLEALCADLTRVTIPGADHWLHHQRPAEIAGAITGWLDRQAAAASG